MEYYPRILGAESSEDVYGPHDYDEVTELEWATYELDTIIYDYRIHPEASARIRDLLQRLAKNANI